MSLYYFGNTYEAFGRTGHETVAKVLVWNILEVSEDFIRLFLQILFVIYMAIVGILLINMLIAMVIIFSKLEDDLERQHLIFYYNQTDG